MELTTAAALYFEFDSPDLTVLETVSLLFVILPISAMLGWWTGNRGRRSVLAAGREIDMVAGEATFGSITAILGLLLAFTFGHGLAVMEKRKTALNAEANAIGTAFLRTDYLAEPGRTELRDALLRYAETRLPGSETNISGEHVVAQFMERTLRVQGELWPITVAATADPLPAPLKAFVAGAVNDVIDAHGERASTINTPISSFAYIVLLAAAITALFLLGNRAGLLGRRLTWRTFVLSLFLMLVMITITDMQRPYDGVITADETLMRATIFDMRAALESG
ncbi:MAG: hypothetical protein AAFR47_02640 [Pseudomonadota bacterium]